MAPRQRARHHADKAVPAHLVPRKVPRRTADQRAAEPALAVTLRARVRRAVLLLLQGAGAVRVPLLLGRLLLGVWVLVVGRRGALRLVVAGLVWLLLLLAIVLLVLVLVLVLTVVLLRIRRVAAMEVSADLVLEGIGAQRLTILLPAAAKPHRSSRRRPDAGRGGRRDLAGAAGPAGTETATGRTDCIRWRARGSLGLVPESRTGPEGAGCSSPTLLRTSRLVDAG